MHFHTVNKHLKDVRLAQRAMREVQEDCSRHYPQIRDKALMLEDQLGQLLDELLQVEYEK